MKKLLAIFLLMFAGNVFANGVFTKQGPLIVFKAACVAPHMERVAGAMQDLPDGQYTMAEMLLALAARADTIFPELTPEETLLCGGELLPLPTWKVARSGTRVDRPVSKIDGYGVRSSTKVRIPVGSPCFPGYRESTTACKDCEWRQVEVPPVPGHMMVAVCELR